jgi:hypothetical protein
MLLKPDLFYLLPVEINKVILSNVINDDYINVRCVNKQFKDISDELELEGRIIIFTKLSILNYFRTTNHDFTIHSIKNHNNKWIYSYKLYKRLSEEYLVIYSEFSDNNNYQALRSSGSIKDDIMELTYYPYLFNGVKLFLPGPELIVGLLKFHPLNYNTKFIKNSITATYNYYLHLFVNFNFDKSQYQLSFNNEMKLLFQD